MLPATFKPLRDLLFQWLWENKNVKIFKPNVLQAPLSVHVILSAQRLSEENMWRKRFLISFSTLKDPADSTCPLLPYLDKTEKAPVHRFNYSKSVSEHVVFSLPL